MTAVQGALSAAERSMRSVFVGNIPYEATEEQLKDIFAEVGPVVSFRLVYDRETGKPKGYGFCEYKDQEMALSAMRNLNSYELNGRALRVDNAASEKSKEELKNLQASLGGPPVESPYGPEVLPDECPDAISKIMCSLPPEQLWDLMVQMKQCAENNPNEARNLLIQNSQLAFAMLQAQVILKLVDPEGAKAMLHPPGFQPPAASTLISVSDTKVANAPGPVRNDNVAQFQNAPLIPMQQNPMMNNIRPSHPGQAMTRPALLGERPPIMNDRPGMQDRPVIMGDRMQGPHNPMQGQHNPMQGQHNLMQGPHNPMQGPHNPMQGPHNPMQGPHNPMQAPFNDRDRDSRALGDHDLRQLPMTDRDMRQPPTTMRDKDMRHAAADQDLRTLGPMGLGDRGFDPRFRNAPTHDRPGFDKPRAGPFENRNIPPRMDDRGPGVRGPQNPRVSAVSESSPRMGGASPMGNNSPQTNNPLAAAAAAIAPHDQEKAALIMQVLQLSDQQISMLPPEQRQSILVLKEQIARTQKM